MKATTNNGIKTKERVNDQSDVYSFIQLHHRDYIFDFLTNEIKAFFFEKERKMLLLIIRN